MIEILIGAIIGCCVGAIAKTLAAKQIDKRTDDKSILVQLNRPIILILWCALTALIGGLIFYIYSDWTLRSLYIIIVAIATAIAAVDGTIKRIPNDSLLILLVAKLLSIIVLMFNGGTFVETILPPLIGFVVGTVLYIVPAFFRIPIGAGDIKFCAVIGFTLGIYGFLESAIVMAVSLLLYLAYLKITKKGNLRTSAPMGPFLALGVIVTIVLPFEELLVSGLNTLI